MQDKEDQIELELDGAEEAEVAVEETVVETDDSSDDQFKKAEDATQKRINRLTKKMREAERQREEALSLSLIHI